MKIDIQGWKDNSILDVPTHVETRMYFALGRFGSRIQRSIVRLRDLNGPKGGLDKHCQIQLFLSDGGQLLIEKRAESWLDVVDAATESAGRALGRLVSKAGVDRRKTIRGMKENVASE